MQLGNRVPWWLALIGCNLVWAVNPTVAKWALADVGPTQTAWARYALTALTLMGVSAWSSRAPHAQNSVSPAFCWPRTLRTGSAFMGLVLTSCVISPLAQMAGLSASSALMNTVLISMEPLFTVFFAWILIRERPKALEGLALLVACAGFLLLARVGELDSGQGLNALRFQGDLLLLLAVAAEGMYSSFSKQLAARGRNMVADYTRATCVGALVLTGFALNERGLAFFLFEGWTLKSALAALWLGSIGTAWTYRVWLQILNKGVSIAAMSLTLFIQPLFGSAVAAWVWGDRLSAAQTLGALLIVGAVAGVVLEPVFRYSQRR